MKSPFPGMDPYLERFWGDVHLSLIAEAREQLRTHLPSGLVARAEMRLFIEPAETQDRHSITDVLILEQYRGPQLSALPRESGAGAAVAEPLIVTAENEPVTQRFIEIRDRSSGNRVITLIEFVSPSNKAAGKGCELFLQKRRECIRAGASWMAIDLTRAGNRALLVPQALHPLSEAADYLACARRAWKKNQYELYPFMLRERLPGIRIPLRKTDSDVHLDLQALVDFCYLHGSYGDRATYSRKLTPPLENGDAKWAEKILKAAGMRGAPASRKVAV